jgi:hypothetical protein
MPIQSGDVKLLKSAIMTDSDQGGGAISGNQIEDGVSNSIFPDISELDRAGGRVSLRKTFAAVQTDDTDTYFGANVIVAEPPEDPLVSVTLFSNGLAFDTRQEAQSRVEAYLNKGPEAAGFLYENHIAGQRIIQLFQRPSDVVPVVGQTVVLVHDEGLGTETEQYVRATKVTVVERTFTYDTDKDYKAAIVSLEISDALRSDFAGSPATRTFTRLATATKIRETVVADAGTYVGVSPLVATAALGDFTVQAESIFSQLVPSAQTETPISDVRANGLSAALAATGSPVTQSMTLGFTTAQNLYVGAPIYPGSLSIARGGATLVDNGGRLLNGSVEVGLVDYDNGIVSLSTNVFGSSPGTHAVTFVPAAVPDLISDQRAILVTPESRSLSYSFVIEDKIAPRTLTLSYLAQGTWYVLRDNGSGALRGSDSSYGAGTLNYSTGAVVVTLGALPDVGSAIVVSSFSEVSVIVQSNTELANGGKAYFAFNTDSVVGEDKGSKQITPGGLTVTWTNGGAKTAADDGNGNLTGDATGTVDYAAGVIRISPNTLPPSGTLFSANLNGKTNATSVGVTLASGTLGVTSIEPGSISFIVPGCRFRYYTNSYGVNLSQYERLGVSVEIRDDGSGNLKIVDLDGSLTNSFGTVNYSTGAITSSLSGVVSPFNGYVAAVSATDPQGPVVSVYGGQTTVYGKMSWDSYTGSRIRHLYIPSGVAFNVTYSNAGASSASVTSATLNELRLRVPSIANYTLKGVRFGIGSDTFVQLPDNVLARNQSPTTGGGTPSGTVSPALGLVSLAYWPTGAAPAVLNWRGLMQPPTSGVNTPFGVSLSIFRTVAAPIRPASFSVLGTLADGTTFNVTAGTNGKINGTRVKGRIDYEFGLAEIYFVNPDGDPASNIDLSHLGISGLTTIPADVVMLPTLRYNAVSFSYLPLDADILGLDPVRLPSDGRVPIFRPGGFAVLGHTGEITATVSNGQTINCARVRLSRVRVVGNDGVVINTGYSANLEAGTVMFSNVTGYSQPVTVQHRIEDMGVVRATNINGEVSLTRPITHDYPLGSFLSSALIVGDMFAEVNTVFDQASWAGAFSDVLVGDAATGTFNLAVNPIVVTNRGAITERWVVRFTSTSAFEIIGEHVGVIATGNTGTNCAPNNPTTGVPYFTIPAVGWGSGWSIGNMLRFNTEGANFPVWVVRTVQQGPESVPDDNFTLLIRGDVDA